MALMSFRSRSHDKVSMVLTRADHLLIHNYIILYIYITCLLLVSDCFPGIDIIISDEDKYTKPVGRPQRGI